MRTDAVSSTQSFSPLRWRRKRQPESSAGKSGSTVYVGYVVRRILLDQHGFGQGHLGTVAGLKLHRQQPVSVRQQQAAACVPILNRLPRLAAVGGERVPGGQAVGGD